MSIKLDMFISKDVTFIQYFLLEEIYGLRDQRAKSFQQCKHIWKCILTGQSKIVTHRYEANIQTRYIRTYDIFTKAIEHTEWDFAILKEILYLNQNTLFAAGVSLERRGGLNFEKTCMVIDTR